MERIEDFLMAFDEPGADDVLRTVGSMRRTPAGWGDLSASSQRDALREILNAQTPDVIDQLDELAPSDAARAHIGDIARYLASLDQSTAAHVLRQAGAQGEFADGWDPILGGSTPATFIDMFLRRQSTSVLTDLAELVAPEEPEPPAPEPEAAPAPEPEPERRETVDREGPIFLVHGHAADIRNDAARTIERVTDREVIVLHEQTEGGRTVIEKFEAHAETAAYAVVLLTGDDVGGVRTSGETRPRARQNVIFELGFFYAVLGRARVAVLAQGDVERPSDVAGLLYITVDPGGAWRYKLTNELEAAGIPVDRGRVPTG
jgi:hypothetical protein